MKKSQLPNSLFLDFVGGEFDPQFNTYCVIIKVPISFMTVKSLKSAWKKLYYFYFSAQ